MKRKAMLLAAVLVCAIGTTAWAQQTGEIFGRVADKSGAVLPGATVTVSGPALIQPRVVTTSETGTYRVPELPIGLYSVTFELAGFRTTVYQDIRVTIGFNAQVNGELELSTVQETVTVTGESPIIDTRETGTKTTFDLETMQNLPSARDPWVMLERTPASRWTASTSAATSRASSPATSRAARAPATTSGRSTASTSPTCPRPARRRSTTTSTCSKKCR